LRFSLIWFARQKSIQLKKNICTERQQMDDLKKRALDYHQFPIPGKLSVESSKPCATQDDLSLAYTPGWRRQC